MVKKEFDKENPFKTPEGYFENFSDGLLDKLSEEKLEVPKEHGFAVPEHYFDELNQNILEKIEAQEPKVIRLNPYRKYYYAAASVAAILLLVLGLNQNAKNEVDFSGLAHSEIESYFESNEIGLYAYEIAEEIPLQELEISDIITNQINDENLINYLDENITDFEELNLENYE